MPPSAALLDRLGDPPAAGEHRALSDTLLWLRLPVPGALNHINLWLVAGDAGWTLVDTGLAIPAVEQAWMAFEERLPMLRSLAQIVVTHHHPDHFGMAAWLSRRHGVAVRMSVEAERATHFREEDPDSRAARMAGFSDELGVEFEPGAEEFVSGRRYRSIVSGTPALGVPLAEGDVLATAAGEFRVSIHHGHAPGHACLHAAATGLLVSGDQVLPTISPNISLYPGIERPDPLGDYLDSLDRLETLPADTLVLPAHGRPFADLHRRLAALRAEHAQRLDRMVAACAQPRSTREVVEATFNLGRLDALNRLLATTETLAHLRYLERRRRLLATGRGTGLRWRAT